jgi:hypothetical protein
VLKAVFLRYHYLSTPGSIDRGTVIPVSLHFFILNDDTFFIKQDSEWQPIIELGWYGVVILWNWLTEMIQGTRENMVYSGIPDVRIDDNTIVSSKKKDSP